MLTEIPQNEVDGYCWAFVFDIALCVCVCNLLYVCLVMVVRLRLEWLRLTVASAQSSKLE